MSTVDFGTMDANASLKQVVEELANVMDKLNFLLNGNIDFKNVRVGSLTADRIKALSITAAQIAAGTITADKITVAELSAIAANLGTITAGIINAVTINGATINAATINIQDDVIIGNNLAVGFGSNNRRITLGGGFITYVGSTLTIDGAFSDVVINSASTITIKSLTDDINLVTNTAFGKHVYANTILLA